MSQTCPHCGTQLPVVVDAFCPACRNCLDDRPEPVTTAAERPTADGSGQSSPRNGLALLASLTGLGLTIFGALGLGRGDLGEAIYTGGFGLALLIVGMMWRGKGGRNDKSSASIPPP